MIIVAIIAKTGKTEVKFRAFNKLFKNSSEIKKHLLKIIRKLLELLEHFRAFIILEFIKTELNHLN